MVEIFLDADVRKIMDFIAVNTVIPYSGSGAGGYSNTHHPERLRKVRGDVYVDIGTLKEYPMESILEDILSKRISVGKLISLAEADDRFQIKMLVEGRISGCCDSEGREVFAPSHTLYLFSAFMPPAAVKSGLPDDPIRISRYVYDKICRDRPNNQITAHGYTEEVLNDIRTALNDPTAIIRVRKEGGAAVAVMTDVPDMKGNPTLAVIKDDIERGYQWIASAYGKHRPALYLRRQMEEGNLLFINKEKINKLAEHAETVPEKDALLYILTNYKQQEVNHPAKKKNMRNIRELVKEREKKGG